MESANSRNRPEKHLLCKYPCLGFQMAEAWDAERGVYWVVDEANDGLNFY